MAQEFTINSAAIETKINELLPSQGGFAPGVDFSASTMVIPIIDLTETAEGSGLRQDLQTSLSLSSITAFSVINTTTTIINTTGFWRVFGTYVMSDLSAAASESSFNLTDGTTTKKITAFLFNDEAQGRIVNQFDFIIKLEAGESLTITSGSTTVQLKGSTRQIADLSGSLVTP